MILFGMPVVMLLLFGFAISTDVKNVRMVVVSSSIDNETQKVIDRINASEYFTVQYFVETVAEAKLLMRDMRADMTLVFSAGYADNPYSHNIQILVDGTDPNSALTRTAYVQQIITNVSSPPVVARMLYNPQMKSAYNFVPADSAKTVKLAILTKYMWFDAYAETVGLDFIKENAPRIILVTGTPGYTRYRTEVIGSAEGGYKVRLGKVNALTDDQLKDYGSMNNYYFHTMHHEFMLLWNICAGKS